MINLKFKLIFGFLIGLSLSASHKLYADPPLALQYMTEAQMKEVKEDIWINANLSKEENADAQQRLSEAPWRWDMVVSYHGNPHPYLFISREVSLFNDGKLDAWQVRIAGFSPKATVASQDIMLGMIEQNTNKIGKVSLTWGKENRGL